MINNSQVFFAATQSVGTAATLAGAGFYFHRRVLRSKNNHQHVNKDGTRDNLIIEDTAGKKILALISQQITIPAFLFTKIVRCPPSTNIDGNNVEDTIICPSMIDNLGGDLWMMLVFPMYVVTCGLIVGRIAAFLSGTPSRQIKTAMAACAFANSTGLPITLLTVVHSNFSSSTEFGRNDPTLFLSLYLLLYPVLQWGIGGWLLTPTDTQNYQSNSEHKIILKENDCINADIIKSKSYSSLASTHSSFSSSSSCGEMSTSSFQYDEELPSINTSHQEDGEKISEEDKSCPECIEKHSLLDLTLEDKHQHFDSSELPSGSVNDDASEIACWNKTRSILASIINTVKNVLRNALQPPIIAALSGILIISVSSLRGLFVNTTGKDKKAPLEFLFEGLYIIGQSAVPINMLILGINLSKTSSSECKSYDLLSTRTTTAIVVGKMIVMPIIGFMTCLLLKGSKIWQLPDEIDETVYLVLMIVFITPTANNIMVMVELSGSASKEGMARLIGWQYLFAPLILSINVAVAVSIAKQS